MTSFEKRPLQYSNLGVAVVISEIRCTWYVCGEQTAASRSTVMETVIKTLAEVPMWHMHSVNVYREYGTGNTTRHCHKCTLMCEGLVQNEDRSKNILYIIIKCTLCSANFGWCLGKNIQCIEMELLNRMYKKIWLTFSSVRKSG